MSHPYYHSRSSAKRWGGEAGDYMWLHCWMDDSKKFTAHPSHRMLRHHSQGIFQGEEHFGKMFTVRSTGREIPTRLVLEMHVAEDFGGYIPDVSDWMAIVAGAEKPEWFTRHPEPLSKRFEEPEKET